MTDKPNQAGRRTVVAALTAIGLIAGLPAVHAAEPGPALKQLIEAANKEGQLDLLWGEAVAGGTAAANMLKTEINKAYGTKINVRYTPGPPLPTIAQQIVADKKAGKPARTDAFVGTTDQHGYLSENAATEVVPWPQFAPGRITDRLVEADGRSLRIYTTLPGGIVYNTRLAPHKPTRLSDLLRPEWKGKIASTPYASTFDLIADPEAWGPDKALDFARKLSAQITGLIRCSDIERIASGEFLAYAMDCGGQDYVKFKERGAPVEHVVPADFAAQRYYYIAIPTNSAHPNAAKLLGVFLLSAEGQKILAATQYTDLHLLPGSRMAETIAAYEKQGITFREYTIAWLQKHPEVMEVIAKSRDILARR